MLRIFTRCSIARHAVLTVRHVAEARTTLSAPLQHKRPSSSTPDKDFTCKRGYKHGLCKSLPDETAARALKLKNLGAETTFPDYDPLDYKQVTLIENWYAMGPPPLSEYRLSFGKYKGKRLDEVPDVYFVKYLIPRRKEIHYAGNARDYIVTAALDEHLRKNPDLKSQAGNKKTVVRESGIKAPSGRRKSM